jgi:hypothetical protein
MAYERRDQKSSSAFGNFVIQDGNAHRVYSARSDSKDSPTEFRVVPSVDPLDGEIQPQVFPVDGDPLKGISDAFCAAEVVSFLGSKKYQFVSETTDFPEKPSPTRMFYNSIKKFVEEEGKKKNPEWSAWCDWKGGLSLPTWVMLMQGCLIRLNGERCKDKNGKPVNIMPVVLMLNRSSTKDMESKLTTAVDPSAVLSPDNSVLGDICSPERGHTLQVYAEVDAMTEKKRFSVKASDVVMPLKVDVIRATFVPWAKLLRKDSAAVQIARLAETFSLDAVKYVFGTDPEYASCLPGTPKKVISTAPAPVRAAPPVPAKPVQVDPEIDEAEFVCPDDVESPEEPETGTPVATGSPEIDELMTNPMMRALIEQRLKAAKEAK